MRKSQRLRLSEVREVFRLIGECRELGADAATWRRHLLVRVCGILPAQVGMGGEANIRGMSEEQNLVTQAVSTGWPSANGERMWLEYTRECMSGGRYRQDPIWSTLFPVGSPEQIGVQGHSLKGRGRPSAPLFQHALEAAEIDDCLCFAQPIQGRGAFNGLLLFRHYRDPSFAAHDRRLAELLLEELGPFLGTALATASDPSTEQLSPRLREVLGGLLEGDSEKQLARRLGLSQLTVHDYVKAVYRHFGVFSRAELLAYFLRRSHLRPATS